jgi:hypothetical protein
MLLNAVLIAIALSLCAFSGQRAAVSTEREWRAPRVERPPFDPFHGYEEFFRPRV